MANDVKNQITITDEQIEFSGFPLIPEAGIISVFHTENSFTIYPYEKSGMFYTSFSLTDNRTIDKKTSLREYVIFRAMIEEIKENESGEYLFVELNGVYLFLVQ